MAHRRRGSIRLWQTELFLVVIVVAMLILSGSLSAGLKVTLARMAETSELRNVSALARRLEPEFPLAVNGMTRVRELVTEYRDIYGGGIWVYDSDGKLLESAYDSAPTERRAGISAAGRAQRKRLRTQQAICDRTAGWSRPSPCAVRAASREGTVVTASDVDLSVAIMQAVRDRLWVTFWVSLVVAGLLGFGFSELVSRRIRAMSDAAAAIAAGDFEQRLSAGFVPDEVQDLADSYNTHGHHPRRGVRRDPGEPASDRGGRRVDGRGRRRVRLLGSGARHQPGGRPVARPHQAATCWARPCETITDEPAVLEVVRKGLAGESAAETVSLGQFIVLLHCTPLLDAEAPWTAPCCCSPT